MAKSVYLTAFVATIAIVLIVLFSVNLGESSRIASLNEEVKQIALEAELQNAFADFDTNNSAVYCTVIGQGIERLSNRASNLEKILSTYKENSVNTEEFYLAKRGFLITEMVLFANLEKAKAYCDMNTKTVLFFYAEDKSCPIDCEVIGVQLDELEKDCSSFRAFRFPYNWPSYEFTKILEVKYDVNSPATLIVNGIHAAVPASVGDMRKWLGCE